VFSGLRAGLLAMLVAVSLCEEQQVQCFVDMAKS